MANFWITACLIFKTNCVKFTEKLEKLLSLGNALIVKKKIAKTWGKLKKKEGRKSRKNFMPGAGDCCFTLQEVAL